LIIGATAATIEYRRTRRIWWLIVAGGLTGLASLSHSDGVVLVVPLCVALWPGRSVGARRRFAPVFVLLATVAVVLTPWTIRNAVVFHAFVPLSNSLGNTMAGTYNSQSASMSPPGVWLVPNNRREFKAVFRAHPVNDPAQDSALIHGALHYIGAHPTYLATVALWNTLHLLQVAFLGRDEASFKHTREPVWAFYLTTVTFWLVFLAAVAGCLTRTARLAPRWLWLIPLFMFLSVVMMGADSARFRSPIDPFLVILAACALDATASRITGAELSPPMSRGALRPLRS
jgi:4-amino-4-deoxy-L-arabinose transferase-like glycosyltransferase